MSDHFLTDFWISRKALAASCMPYSVMFVSP